jgi:hypothetical protein
VILRKIIYIFILVMYITVGVARFGLPDVMASEISNISLVQYANKERTRKNVHPLKYNKKLEAAAYQKAQDMFKKQYWAHFGPNNEKPWDFMTTAGYQWTFAGENLAKGFFDSEDVHSAWMQSPSHRDNILDASYDEIGIAVVKGNLQGNEIFLVVQMFGSSEIKTAGTARRDYPKVRIISPEEGDILEDGAFTVRGETNKIVNDHVDLFVNNEFYKGIGAANNQFQGQVTDQNKYGDLTITTKALGQDEEYLADFVTVKVLNPKLDKSIDLSTCIERKNDLIYIFFRVTCENLNLQELQIKIGNITFNSEKGNPRQVSIPKSSISSESEYYDVSMKFTDGKNNYFRIKREEQIFTAGNLNIEGDTLFSVKNILAASFVVVGILIIAYAFYLMKKGIFVRHRNEVVMMCIAVGILLLTLITGVINV